jgi:hypothetical protein
MDNSDFIFDLLTKSLEKSSLTEDEKKSWVFTFKAAPQNELESIICNALRKEIESANEIVKKIPNLVVRLTNSNKA